jgi:hypothetical protein
VIEAVQWDGTYTSMRAIEKLFPSLQFAGQSYHEKRDCVYRWDIQTLEGSHVVSPGDWIIKGVKGEFYPCKPDVFAATYESADSPAPAKKENERG